MKFTKMQGLGNDYIYVNCFEETVDDPSALARILSDRHFGIGSDGLILIQPSDVADAKMDMYNADGSRGLMCGNGVRCLGKYVYDHGIARKPEIDIETAAGIRHISIETDADGKAAFLTVNMGKPELISEPQEEIVVDGEKFIFTGISTGSEHAVVFVDDLDTFDFERFGPKFEVHERFPDRINTEFVEVLSPGTARVRVWERGSGETLACGTGASAVVAAGALRGIMADDADIILRGGTLHIRWDRGEDTIYMSGPAVEVFNGEIQWDEKQL